MTLDRRITGGLAWAGLLLVIGVPSADALTSYLSDRDASVLPAVVAPEQQAEPVAAKPVAETKPAATKPAVVQQVAASKPQAAPVADPVDRFVASGKKLPSYISDGGGAEATESTEVASTQPVQQQPAAKPAQQTDDIAVASITPQQEQPVVREPELVAPIPMPASMRPHPRAVARTVPPAEVPPQVVANDGGDDFISADDLRDWESGPLSEFLAKRRQQDAGGGDYIQYDAGDAPVYW